MHLAYALSLFGSFEMKDKMLTNDHHALVSIPMYSKMAGISVNEVTYENYVARLKPEYNNKKFITEVLYQDIDKLITTYSHLAPSENNNYKNLINGKSWTANEEDNFM